MDKIQLTTKDDDYPIIFRVLTISGGDRRISEPSTGYRSFHGIPWLDPMNSVEITGQMRLKYRNNATVVVQGWCLTLVGCVFFFVAQQLAGGHCIHLGLVQVASCLLPYQSFFFWLGGIEVPEADMFFFFFYLLMNPMFEEYEVIFETYDFVFSRTCHRILPQEFRNEMKRTCPKLQQVSLSRRHA